MRLIDADAADVTTLTCTITGTGCIVHLGKWLDEQSTVDAEPVVRCKDCVHAGAFPNAYTERRFAGRMNCYLCRGDDGYGVANVSVVYPDDYCSDGVRKVKEDAVD